MNVKSKEDLLWPVVIGVTGHRDIEKENYAILQIKVEEILREIRELCPNSPMILLSPLAEGADRIAARAAIKLGIDLVVPLPMDIDEYEEDFDKDSREEFREIIIKSTKYFKVPTDEESAKINRDLFYEDLGVFINKNSNILIAMWNGIYSGKCGGTSEVVNYRLNEASNKCSEDIHSFNHAGCGPVYHIVTPRIENEEILGERFNIYMKFPSIKQENYSYDEYSNKIKEAKDSYYTLLKRVDGMNQHIKNMKTL